MTDFCVCTVPLKNTPRRIAVRTGVPPAAFILTAVLLSTGLSPAADDELERQIDASIAAALPWLADAQQPSGAWTLEHSSQESTAITSLAVLAFLAAGQVPDEGPWGDHVTRGVDWVLQQQREDGLLQDIFGHGPMYGHGISTLMLAEVSGMLPEDREPACRRVLERAVRLIIDAQNQPRSPAADGGWRYQPTSRDSDLSVTAWQLLALRAARDIGCDVPVENIDRATAYIRRLSVPGGGFGYVSPRGTTATRAGTGIVALEVCGEHRSRITLAAARYLQQNPLTPDEGYFYYGAYYCTVGMYKTGGDEWMRIRPALYSTILNAQQPGGFWEPRGGSESAAGRVYATSLSLLALSVEYAFLPIYQR